MQERAVLPKAALSAAYQHRQKQFRAARRHTALVRFLRLGIPIGCVGTLAGLTFFTFFDPLRAVKGNVSVEKIAIVDSKIVMDAPKLTGYKKDNRAYVVNARTAAQNPAKTNIVELNEVSADIELQNNGWAKVQADSGVYDSQLDRISLRGHVRVRTDSGYDARSTVADVDMKAGHVVVDAPVNVITSNGTVASERMEVFDNGTRITFVGKVISIFVPKADDSKP
jgi:lipopolysaccharide export system protein LptC